MSKSVNGFVIVILIPLSSQIEFTLRYERYYLHKCLFYNVFVLSALLINDGFYYYYINSLFRNGADNSQSSGNNSHTGMNNSQICEHNCHPIKICFNYGRY